MSNITERYGCNEFLALLCFSALPKKKYHLIESFVLNLKSRAAQKGRASGVFLLHKLCVKCEIATPAHLGSHRNLVFSPSSLQISHSLKEG